MKYKITIEEKITQKKEVEIELEFPHYLIKEVFDDWGDYVSTTWVRITKDFVTEIEKESDIYSISKVPTKLDDVYDEYFKRIVYQDHFEPSTAKKFQSVSDHIRSLL